MARRHIALSLSAAITAASSFPASTASAQVGVTADRVAQCEYEARLYGEQRVVLGVRIKVPLAAGAAMAFGAGPLGVVLAATIASNAESPIERRAIVRYRNWCLGLMTEPPPGVQ